MNLRCGRGRHEYDAVLAAIRATVEKSPGSAAPAEDLARVTKASLGFPDAHYGGRFATLPMPKPIMHIVGMLPAQVRRKTGEIEIPAAARQGHYDLVVFGSPTWWLTTCMPIRSFLQSSAAKALLAGTPFAGVSVSRRYYKGNLGDIRKLGEQAGGTRAGSTHFVSEGNQVMSMASWLVFMRQNEPRGRYLGVPLPPPNLRRNYAEQAKAFADELAGDTPAVPRSPNPAAYPTATPR